LDKRVVVKLGHRVSNNRNRIPIRKKNRGAVDKDGLRISSVFGALPQTLGYLMDKK
jgi:hypothetical protein